MSRSEIDQSRRRRWPLPRRRDRRPAPIATRMTGTNGPPVGGSSTAFQPRTTSTAPTIACQPIPSPANARRTAAMSRATPTPDQQRHRHRVTIVPTYRAMAQTDADTIVETNTKAVCGQAAHRIRPAGSSSISPSTARRTRRRAPSRRATDGPGRVRPARRPPRGSSSASVPTPGVDHVQEGFAREIAANVLDDQVVEELVGGPGHVRRDDDVRCIPDRIVGRQRLRREDVEDGAGDASGLQRLDQRRLVDERSARDVDEPGPWRAAPRGSRASTMPVDALVSGIVRIRRSASAATSRQRLDANDPLGDDPVGVAGPRDAVANRHGGRPAAV